MSEKKTPKQVTGKSQPEMVVLTTRITVTERDQIRAAAGWGGLQRFVHDAVMAAVEKASKK
ncbi:MAG TPA: hypothetical protein VEW47_10320 [Candidatus Dormibacteraeota bacterium]|nr:hypothetical protein [Candidatus Dormibacteraeota bacterium]